MADDKHAQYDETLVIALEQLGKALDMMQGLFARIEAHVADRRREGNDDKDAEQVELSADIPEVYTLH